MKLFLVILFICLHEIRGDIKSEMLEVHNKLRRGILDGTEPLQPKAKSMPMLTWNEDLAKNAQKLADTCVMEHNKATDREVPGFKYVGQNLYSGPKTSTNEAAVVAWYNEISEYDYETLKCSGVCGHYTQVVWAGTTQVGCARSSSCADGNVIIACDYAAAGNYIGEKPYVKDDSVTRAPVSTLKPAPVVLNAYAKKMLDTHNEYRKMVLDGFYMEQPQAKSMNTLVWNAQLAESAQKLTDTCKTEPTAANTRAIPGYPNVGQSIHFCVTQGWQDARSVEVWFSEQSRYNHAADTCKGFCGNYKQIVWANTREIGCAKTVCGERTIAVCHYAEGANRNSGRPYEAVPEKDRPTTLPPTPPPSKPIKNKFMVWGDAAQTKPSSFQEEMVALHNNYRKNVLNGDESRQPQASLMPMLQWNPTLATNAQAHVEACEFNYAMPATRLIANYSYVNRNLLVRQEMLPDYPVDGRVAMEDWYSQVNFYDYDTNRCSSYCDHYTQIVASKTTQIGCGMAKCPNDKVFIACDYAEGESPCTKKQPYPSVPKPTPTQMEKEMLEAHNKLRLGILKGTEKRQPYAMSMDMYKWNRKLAQYAQEQADRCTSENDPKKRKAKIWEYENVGQNFYETFGENPTNSEAVENWYSAIDRYDYDRNRCNSRSTTSCDSYLQVVNARTYMVGCGRSRSCSFTKVIIICYYGEGYVTRNWPYMKGTPTTTLAPTTTPPPPTTTTPAPVTVTFNPVAYTNDMLTYLNSFRKMLLDGTEYRQPRAKEMPMLQWDSELAANALKAATNCKAGMSAPKDRQTSKFNNVGEIYNSVQTPDLLSAVRGWWGGASWYTYLNNRCDLGDGMCDPYRLIAYDKATFVGCATTFCNGQYRTVCHFSQAISNLERPYINANPFKPDATYIDQFQRGHNGVRTRIVRGWETRVPRAKSLPDLVWDEDLAISAKQMADLCTFLPSEPIQRQSKKYSNVGENMYKEQLGPTSPSRAMSSWLSAIDNYDHVKNVCRNGASSCYPFLQMAWAKTVAFGCGTTECRQQTHTYCHYSQAVVPGELPYERV